MEEFEEGMGGKQLLEKRGGELFYGSKLTGRVGGGIYCRELSINSQFRHPLIITATSKRRWLFQNGDFHSNRMSPILALSSLITLVLVLIRSRIAEDCKFYELACFLWSSTSQTLTTVRL